MKNRRTSRDDPRRRAVWSPGGGPQRGRRPRGSLCRSRSRRLVGDRPSSRATRISDSDPPLSPRSRPSGSQEPGACGVALPCGGCSPAHPQPGDAPPGCASPCRSPACPLGRGAGASGAAAGVCGRADRRGASERSHARRQRRAAGRAGAARGSVRSEGLVPPRRSQSRGQASGPEGDRWRPGEGQEGRSPTAESQAPSGDKLGSFSPSSNRRESSLGPRQA